MNFDLYNMDALEMLSKLDDNSVNLIVTSPPYADQRKSTYGGVKPSEYVEWILPYTKEFKRVLTDDGSFILNIKEKVVDGQRHPYVLKLVLAMMEEQEWKWTEEYIWHKTTTTPGKWPNRFRDLWEHCYHFTKNKKFVMNQDDVMVPIGDWSKTRLSKLSKNDNERKTSNTGSGYGRNVSSWVGKDKVYPGNVLHGSSETKNRGHSATYPVWLPEWFIKLFSNENDVVLDPFMGSGSTAIAALNLKRNVIGAELLEDYSTKCIERVKKQHPNETITLIQ